MSLDGWLYKRPITIDNTGNSSTLTDYQIRIDLDSTNFDFTKANSDGSDIRITDTDGTTLLPLWIEKWDSANQQAVIWTKVPSIPASSTYTIYLYYGNPSATSVSSVTETFIREIDGVVGSWHFDEGSGTTVYDSSGNGNNGTINGATWVDGKFDKALSFDGVNDYVQAPDSASLDITDTLTLEVWVKGDPFQLNYWGRILDHFNWANKEGYVIARNINTNTVRFGFCDTEGVAYGVDTITLVTDGVWHHIVGTYDGTYMRIYADGVEEVSNNIGSVTIKPTTNPLYIGGGYDGNTWHYFKGIIDEARIYNRALSPAEISDLYNNYGYTTTNYPGKVLIRKYTSPEPTTTVGAEGLQKTDEVDSLLKGILTVNDEIDSILPAFLTLQDDINAILRAKTLDEITAILRGKTLNELNSLLQAFAHLQDEIDITLQGRLGDDIPAIIQSKQTDEIDFITPGKNLDETPFTLWGRASLYNRISAILRGIIKLQDEFDALLKGKGYDDISLIINTKDHDEISILLQTYEEPQRARRLILSDLLKLRDTSVYRNPRDISVLKVIYGDLSTVKVPCTPLDPDGTIYHISDRPIMAINKVYVNGEPQGYGYRSYTSYQDETGRAIACIVFDNPQYDASVAVSCKGVINEQGKLIENPAEILRDLLLNIQGYGEDSVDRMALSRFYSDCLREEIVCACVLDRIIPLRDFLNELALNIHARWMISDGKSVMRLRWL